MISVPQWVGKVKEDLEEMIESLVFTPEGLLIKRGRKEEFVYYDDLEKLEVRGEIEYKKTTDKKIRRDFIDSIEAWCWWYPYEVRFQRSTRKQRSCE